MPMPELQHNLRLLVDLAEADITRTDGQLRHAQDTAVLLGREQVRWVLRQALSSLIHRDLEGLVAHESRPHYCVCLCILHRACLLYC